LQHAPTERLDGEVTLRMRPSVPSDVRQSDAVAPSGAKVAALSGNVEVELILLFSVVAETLSFTKAAQRLGIDQSWLSHKVRQLESSLGLKLFVRTTRNVELTAAGRALLDPAQRLAEVAAQARATAELLRTSMAGAVRVGALPFSFPDTQRMALLDRFMRAHPDVQIVVANGPTPTLMEHLRAGRIDLAFVSAPFNERGLDMLLLRENRYCVLMPEDHPLATNPVLTADMLQGVRIIVPSQHFSPAAYDVYYRPVIEAGIVPVAVPEFEGPVNYATEWRLPVVCTQYAAERRKRPGFVTRQLDFVPACKKYLVRLADHRTPLQRLLWDSVEADRLN
jgi:DNA-binding transcriptional LysR family regulator